jgi:hypothetical protein
MSSSTTPDPDRRDRLHPDPLTMTPGEKLMAEWEARHDVLARGARATPGAVQHYLSESHSREACDKAAEPPHPHRARPHREPPPEPKTSWWLRPAR